MAETGRSCWGSGQQDASAAQGTKRMLGAATRKARRAFSIVLHPGAPGGLPYGAQHLFFRLGKLFQGGFPAQSGAFVRAAL